MSTLQFFKSEEGKQAVLNYYDKLLAEWNFPHDNQFLSTSFGETHVISVGIDENPPLILLHGSGTNATMWLGDMIPFSKIFKVHAVDIVGQPSKSAEVRPDLNSDGYAMWMKEVMEGLGLSKASFVGNSLGGWVCFRFATTYPEFVEKLALIATSGVSDVKLSSTLLILFLVMRGEKGMLKLQQLIYGQDDIPQIVVDYSKLMMDHFSPIIDKIPVFTDEELRLLDMPVLFMGGEDDFFMHSQKSANRLNLLLSDVETIVIPENGHVIFDATNQIIPFLLR